MEMELFLNQTGDLKKHPVGGEKQTEDNVILLNKKYSNAISFQVLEF